MKVIYNEKDKFKFDTPTGVGLGNFDGLHVGHMALINTLIEESQKNGLESVVYTFDKHPENILRKKLITPLLTTVRKKIQLLQETPLDYLYFDKFDEAFSRLKPEEYVKTVLVDRLNVKLAVAGFNYRFGYMGQGNTELLKKLGEIHGFKVIIIEPVKIDDQIVSSTLIRNELSKGRMDNVTKYLGRYYSITGQVCGGKQIGNTIGFPTANIDPEDYLIMPSYGVYVTRTLLDGVLHDSVTNVGLNPTFGEIKKPAVETHILDFNENIYGKDIEVFFLKKLRGEMKFKSVDQLVAQMKKDVQNTREFLKLNG